MTPQVGSLPNKMELVLDSSVLPLDEKYECTPIRLLTDDRGVRSLVVSVNPTYLNKKHISSEYMLLQARAKSGIDEPWPHPSIGVNIYAWEGLAETTLVWSDLEVLGVGGLFAAP